MGRAEPVRALDRARGQEEEAIDPVSEIIPRRVRLRLQEPLMTRDGYDEAPIEPGARWNIEPCDAAPPANPWRFTTP